MERLRAGKRTGRAHLSLDCISIGSNAKQGEKGPTKLRRRWEEEKRGAASGRQVTLEASRAFHTAPGSLSLSGLARTDDGKSEAIDSALTSSDLLNSHPHYSTLQSSSPPYSQTPRPLPLISIPWPLPRHPHARPLPTTRFLSLSPSTLVTLST